MKPLDPHYGAGEINAYESYLILTGDEQGFGGTISDYGWDYGTMPSSATVREHTISVSDDPYLNELSVVLNWNRTITGGGTLRDHDLAIDLVDDATGLVVWDESDSDEDNFEHIYYRNLPTGDYRLRVSRSDTEPDTVQYGLAWRMDSGRGPEIVDVVHDGADLTLTIENLDPGMTYTMQRSPDLATGNWSNIDTTFVPDEVTNDWIDAGVPGRRQFYRLCWMPQSISGMVGHPREG